VNRSRLSKCNSTNSAASSGAEKTSSPLTKRLNKWCKPPSTSTRRRLGMSGIPRQTYHNFELRTLDPALMHEWNRVHARRCTSRRADPIPARPSTVPGSRLHRMNDPFESRVFAPCDISLNTIAGLNLRSCLASRYPYRDGGIGGGRCADRREDNRRQEWQVFHNGESVAYPRLLTVPAVPSGLACS
jgi:hypothetical protein